MRSTRSLYCLVCLLIFATAAPLSAETPFIDFGGERYRLEYQDRVQTPEGGPGNPVAEFTREGETVKNWTKLFAYYAYPEAGDDPMRMAEEVGKEVKRQNPEANFAVNEDERNGNALVDFITWGPGSDVMEFNVFKFAPAGSGSGLVALQYAQRIRADDTDGMQLRALRQRMIAEMIDTPIDQAQSYFAAKSDEAPSSADTRGSDSAANGGGRGLIGQAAAGTGP